MAATSAARTIKMTGKEILANDSEDISRGFETVAVTVESPAITTGDFEYVPHVICGPGVNIDFAQSMYSGCNCDDECNESTCLCILRYGPNYNKQGHLLKTENEAGYCLPVFECNGSCSCPASCSNRLSQQGIQINLQVFQSKNRGLGVRTLQRIHKARYICEYSGEIIGYKEAKQRTTKLCRHDKSYLFVLKEHVADGKVLRTHIDASTHGNAARFMNHSCDPNMYMFPVRVNCPVPRLSLFASQDIEVGEELTFSYGDIMSRDEQNSTARQNTSSNFNIPRTECLCGKSSCAGYLPFDQCLYNS